MSFEQGESFRPDTDDLKPFIPEKKKVSKFKPADEEALKRLESSREQRNKDLERYGPAVDDIKTLLLPPNQLEVILSVLGKRFETEEKETLLDKLNGITANINSAAVRELQLLGYPPIEVNDRDRVRTLLNKTINNIEQAKPKEISTATEVIDIINKIFTQEDLKELSLIFSKRFEYLFKEQKKYYKLQDLKLQQ